MTTNISHGWTSAATPDGSDVTPTNFNNHSITGDVDFASHKAIDVSEIAAPNGASTVAGTNLVLSGGTGNGGAGAPGVVTVYGGAADDTGGSIEVFAGNGPSGKAGGDAALSGGTGNNNAYGPGEVIALGANATANGLVDILTDGSYGVSGQALVSNGSAGDTVWGGIATGLGAPSAAPDSHLPVYRDTASGKVYVWDGSAWQAAVPQGGSIVAGWSSQSALPSGLVQDVYVRSSGTITAWTLIADATGSASVAISKCAYSGYDGSLSSIVASAPPTLSSAVKATSSTLTGWTTSVTAGDVLRFTLSSASGLDRLVIVLDF